MPIIIALLFIGALLLEVSLTSLPLVLVALIILYIFTKNTSVIALGFFLGLILDSLLVRQFGATSLFFSLFLLLVHLYERKFEIRTLPFAVIAVLVGTLFYSLLFKTPLLFGQILVTSFIAGGVYTFFDFVTRKSHKTAYYL